MGGDVRHRDGARLSGGDAAQVGAAGRRRWPHGGGAGAGRPSAIEGPRTRAPRVAAHPRDPAQGVGVLRGGGARTRAGEPNHDVVHRRAPPRRSGRADLRGAADAKVDGLRMAPAASRPVQSGGARAAGRGASGGDSPLLGGQPAALRRAQGLVERGRTPPDALGIDGPVARYAPTPLRTPRSRTSGESVYGCKRPMKQRTPRRQLR